MTEHVEKEHNGVPELAREPPAWVRSSLSLSVLTVRFLILSQKPRNIFKDLSFLSFLTILLMI